MLFNHLNLVLLVGLGFRKISAILWDHLGPSGTISISKSGRAAEVVGHLFEFEAATGATLPDSIFIDSMVLDG